MLLFGFQGFLEYVLFLLIQGSREFGFLRTRRFFRIGISLDQLFFHQVFIEGSEGTHHGIDRLAGKAGA
jgi:hypothetical protein